MLQSFQGSGNLTVNLVTIRNPKGTVRVLLFDNRDGFPGESRKALQSVDGKIANGTCSVTFENIPYGIYAVCAYHDENANGQFDETWYGMPKEGVGVSNNPDLGVFSPPVFDKSKFNFTTPGQQITISLEYL